MQSYYLFVLLFSFLTTLTHALPSITLFYLWDDYKKWSLYLWSKVFNVGLFFLQGGLGDEHGEVAVLHTQFLNFSVKEVFNGLPDGEGPGPKDITAAYIIVLNHLCFSDDLKRTNVTLKGEFFKKVKPFF